MKVVGLIAEYNPFHNGHLYHIEKAKELTGADYVVVVMSGDFVQRGTPAMIQKHIRAKMALHCGADLVLELPVNYATATAEQFAYGGVKILDSLNLVDSICFGSECGNTSELMEIAQILVNEPAWYCAALKDNLKNGMSYPAARAAALPKYAAILSEPNNILGIEYCKALIRLDSQIRPITIKRQGAGYHDALSRNSFASASGIREYIKRLEYNKISESEELTKQIPRPALLVLNKELETNGFTSEDDLSQLLLYKLMKLQSPDDLVRYTDISEELANRIFKQRYHFQSFSQFSNLLKTKEVTHTRINRALLHFILELKTNFPDDIYGRILGFKKSSSELLSKIKKSCRIPLISKSAAADIYLSENQNLVFLKSVEASNLYEMILAQKAKRSITHEYQKSVIILE